MDYDVSIIEGMAIERLLEFGDINTAERVINIGCFIGLAKDHKEGVYVVIDFEKDQIRNPAHHCRYSQYLLHKLFDFTNFL